MTTIPVSKKQQADNRKPVEKVVAAILSVDDISPVVAMAYVSRCEFDITEHERAWARERIQKDPQVLSRLVAG